VQQATIHRSTVVKIVEQSRRAFSKKLIRPLSVQNPKGERFRRPALPFAAGARDGEYYDGGTAARRGKILTRVGMSFGATYALDI